MPSPEKVNVNTFIDLLYAAHLSSYVDSPFDGRGGLMLVGPPAVLKSSLLNVLDRHYYNAIALSDVNAQALGDYRNQIAQGSIRTLVLSELNKLYERDPRTAKNVVGTLRAMAEEGFRGASFDDARMNRFVARCTIIGAMTPEIQQAHFKEWEESGFNRRFLWPLLSLEDPEILERAVVEQMRIEFAEGGAPQIPDGLIPNRTTREERQSLRTFVKYQPGGSHAAQLQLLVKMLAVLKWWYPRIGRSETAAWAAMREFGRTLHRHGALLIVPEPGVNGHRRVRLTALQRRRSAAMKRVWAKRKKGKGK